jgi:hypothetical protein
MLKVLPKLSRMQINQLFMNIRFGSDVAIQGRISRKPHEMAGFGQKLPHKDVPTSRRTGMSESDEHPKIN